MPCAASVSDVAIFRSTLRILEFKTFAPSNIAWTPGPVSLGTCI